MWLNRRKTGFSIDEKSIAYYHILQILYIRRHIMKVLNIGSMNLDLVYSVDHIVQPGETESGILVDAQNGTVTVPEALIPYMGTDIIK